MLWSQACFASSPASSQNRATERAHFERMKAAAVSASFAKLCAAVCLEHTGSLCSVLCCCRDAISVVVGVSSR